MELTYKLTFADYVQFNLYTAHTTPKVRQRRRLTRFIGAITYLLIGFLLLLVAKTYDKGDFVIGVTTSIFGLLWFILYPFYSAWRYKRHYTSYVKDRYKNRVDREIRLEIQAEYLLTSDENSESKIKTREIDELVELKGQFLIQLKSGISIVVPKRKHIDAEAFRQIFREMKITYTDLQEWEWR